jgi:redox-sensitive bicupin YhaK (pirin superfamily)
MSTTIELVIHGRPRGLGDGFMVRRALPSPMRRLVGPFIFFDHFGPVVLAPGEGMDVRPHPHIGLATVTYLFEGEIVHRDSLGSHQTIVPGDVNWMTAGRGIVHSERTGEARRRSGSRMHGLQLWVALPTAHEETEPAFRHDAASTLPVVSRPAATLRVVAGEAYGARSPVPVLSPLFYVDASLEAGAELALPDEHEERAVYVVEGAIEEGGERFDAGTMIVASKGAKVAVRAPAGPARVMLLGGAPLDGPRHIDWNFVSSSKERIEKAKGDWRERRFPKVPGDEVEWIPLPDDGPPR